MTISQDDPRLSFISESEISEPKPGLVQCLKNHWWVAHPEKGLLMWDKHYPQCNPNQHVTAQIFPKLYPWAEVRFVPVAFIAVRP